MEALDTYLFNYFWMVSVSTIIYLKLGDSIYSNQRWTPVEYLELMQQRTVNVIVRGFLALIFAIFKEEISLIGIFEAPA